VCVFMSVSVDECECAHERERKNDRDTSGIFQERRSIPQQRERRSREREDLERVSHTHTYRKVGESFHREKSSRTRYRTEFRRESLRVRECESSREQHNTEEKYAPTKRGGRDRERTETPQRWSE
jgi:chaperonin cofactor prefoldin